MHRPSGSRVSSPPSWPAASCIWRKRTSSSPRGERVAGPANGVKRHGRAEIRDLFRAASRSRARFIAVVAAAPSMALDRLAADGVMAFDRFRRPLTAHERGQRLGAGLSQRQIENLDRWGYPYVFEDFRFHLTLTGPIDADRRGSVLALLQARFDAIDGGHSLPITRLSLLRQDAWSTPFRVVGQAALTAVRSPQ